MRWKKPRPSLDLGVQPVGLTLDVHHVAGLILDVQPAEGLTYENRLSNRLGSCW